MVLFSGSCKPVFPVSTRALYKPNEWKNLHQGTHNFIQRIESNGHRFSLIQASGDIMRVLRKNLAPSAVMEKAGIDECFFDVTAMVVSDGA